MYPAALPRTQSPVKVRALRPKTSQSLLFVHVPATLPRTQVSAKSRALREKTIQFCNGRFYLSMYPATLPRTQSSSQLRAPREKQASSAMVFSVYPCISQHCHAHSLQPSYMQTSQFCKGFCLSMYPASSPRIQFSAKLRALSILQYRHARRTNATNHKRFNGSLCLVDSGPWCGAD